MTTIPQTAIGRLASVSFDCPDPAVLADFYGSVLGLARAYESPDGGVISLSDGRFAVTMMRTTDHVAPTWPDSRQQQQVHLDILVDDLDVAVARTVALGATEAAHQPAPAAWRVLLDPAGHPFCLTTVTGD
ncbi:VOC family protein [Terrabacter sp. NPDC080008]|uniref:VOC family protein n=1 Tax=Terrabacter sp. NPDC080008 TaxID=3155176 RepID=UPI00344F59A0